jgi:hypothetical protein
MSLDSARFRYSITVVTQDRAVFFCLRGLCEAAEEDPAREIGLAEAGITAWVNADGRVKLRFSDAKYRSAFLGDATRLLAGKWTRIVLRDDDPPAA